jgi:hypothetical protein
MGSVDPSCSSFQLRILRFATLIYAPRNPVKDLFSEGS